MRLAIKLVCRTAALFFLVLACYFIFHLRGALAVAMLACVAFTLRVFEWIDGWAREKEEVKEQNCDY